jgi:HAD superfamily hydrolase (TIGR01509 family)
VLRAVIFDCDGVIADSEPAHLRAFQRVLAAEGIALSETDYYERYLAMDDRGCFTAVFRDAGRGLAPGRLADLVARKARAYAEEAGAGPDLIPGAADLARALGARYPCAVASGALRHEVDLVLRAAALEAIFRVVVTAEDVTRGKPDPESYLTALARLNAASGAQPAIAPGECLVIEDSRLGIAAARRAGMRALAITTSYGAEALAEADLVVGSFQGLAPGRLAALFEAPPPPPGRSS